MQLSKGNRLHRSEWRTARLINYLILELDLEPREQQDNSIVRDLSKTWLWYFTSPFTECERLSVKSKASRLHLKPDAASYSHQITIIISPYILHKTFYYDMLPRQFSKFTIIKCTHIDHEAASHDLYKVLQNQRAGSAAMNAIVYSFT